MLMVISSKLAHDALRQFKPPAACAETLELRHFNLAQMRHDNFALAPEMSNLGTYGVMLRRFGFSGFVVFQWEGRRVIHRMTTS